MPRFHRLPCAVLAAFLLIPIGGSAASEGRLLQFGGTSLSGTYLAGRHAGRERDMDTAAAYFSRALEKDPANPVLLERTFVHELSAGNIDRAEELAGSVVDISADHRMARFLLGLRAVRDDRHEEARAHFAEAAYTPLGELTAGLLTAWSLAHEGNLDEALTALDALDSYDAFGNFKLLHTGLIAAYLGNQERAEQAYREAYERAGTSLRVVQAFGNFLERTGRASEAADIYDQFLATSQRNPLVMEARARIDQGGLAEPFIADAQDGMAEALFSLASAMSAEQSVDVSLIYAQLALSLKPELQVAQVLLGEIYQDTKFYDKAIEVFETIPDDSPLRPSAEIQIATNLDHLEKFDEALARIDRLLAERPDNFDALVARGNLMRMHKKWTEAAESYSRALDLVGTAEHEHWTVVYFRGIAHERAGSWDLAEADFRLALELEPDHPSVLNYLGYSLIEQRQDLHEALEMVRKAVELRPNDGYIVDSLGWAYYRLGDYEEAVTHLERAIGLPCGDHQCSSDPVINDHLGDAYWKVGRKIEARFQWRHARDSNPEPEDLERIERKLVEGLVDEDGPAPVQSAGDPDES